jgi:hypothetical protein
VGKAKPRVLVLFSGYNRKDYTLKMEAESYSEIPTPVYSNTRHYIPKDSISLEL